MSEPTAINRDGDFWTSVGWEPRLCKMCGHMHHARVAGLHPRRAPNWRYCEDKNCECRVLHGYSPGEQVERVRALIANAKKVSPSDRMTIYVGDMEHALGLRDQPARVRTGSNDGSETT